MRLLQTTSSLKNGKVARHEMYRTDDVKFLEDLQEKLIQSGLNSGWELLEDTIGIENEDYRITWLIVE